ncbi:hypothetical protein J3454_15340 [Erythrobacter sp. NFXS35]|uniref:hypothetical protein n=1 Tax=Erythrobacter sp. NFXS35 TaxID=2818436 RepID=UPI0032DE306E
MTSKKRKDSRKRSRVAVNFTSEQYGELEQKAGSKPLAEFCRERILLSDRYHDPLFDVSAKLNGSAARMKRFAELLKAWDTARLIALIESGFDKKYDVDPEFQRLVSEGVQLCRELSGQGREVTRLLTERETAVRVVRPVKSGKPQP